MKILGIILLSALGLGFLRAADSQPPFYQIERLDDLHNYGAVRNILMNNLGHVAALIDNEYSGLHLFLRSPKRTIEIPLPPGILEPGSLVSLNVHGSMLFRNAVAYSAYRYHHGKFLNLTNLVPYKYFNPVAINNRGRLVGGAQRDAGSPICAFSYYRGRHKELGSLLPGLHSLAIAVNNHGVTVGAAYYQTNEVVFFGDNYHAVVFKKGQAKDLGVVDGATSSLATGVNSRGTVIGTSSFWPATEEGRTSYTWGFVYRDGTMSPLLPLPGDRHSHVNSINRRGQIVGYSDDGDGEQTAVLYQNGDVFNLNELLPPDIYPELSKAVSINDRGVIVAINQHGEAFLLTPAKRPTNTPTPATER